jgi:mono/diheme cytochrome c family protein
MGEIRVRRLQSRMHPRYPARPVLTRADLKTYQLSIAMCSVLFGAAIASAQTPPADTGLTGNPVFEKDCAKCHGKTAEGRHFAGPSLVSEKAAAASPDELRNIIANGKGHMPKFASKLTPEEIDTLVRQIRALNKK